ncbi:unnamed protein product [Paramecium octaurelia]|uniref:Transmembrane protein n=1 Tax=Paramecium octaurelia TaxID=43137 RepID=A0A8S1WN32_PAROT|nr:unnamed protein product [Paramecium octaurelia]
MVILNIWKIVLNENLINCLECLNNPKEWYKKPFCIFDLYFDDEGGTQQQIYSSTTYFFLDGVEVTLCLFCEGTNFTDVEDQYLDYQYQNLNFKTFCQGSSLVDFQCYKCQLPGCFICNLSIQGQQCLKCVYNRQLINGQCIYIYDIDPTYTCRSPWYVTSKKKCTLCPISKCKYCFEYQTNNLYKSTLYQNFESFIEGESFEVGCALCEDNYIFNFITKKCIYQKPKLSNCLRAYINQDDQEVCTLSEIDDFTVAPEIVNCQKYIPNCLQCLLSPESTLKCIICSEGYTTSITNGDCYKNDLTNTIIVIEGDISLKNGWIQRIQSFMMQFLPNKYFYPKSGAESYIKGVIVECQQGYKEGGNSICEKFCDSSCLSCLTNADGFYCAKCPLNYYQQPIRDQQQGECSECPQLCKICQSRTTEEIYQAQPSYVLDDSNYIYTKKCLRPIKDSNIIYDSYLQSARYCLESNCLNQLSYELKFTYCGGVVVFWPFGYDYGININYCNQMGIDRITIIFKYEIQGSFCGIRYSLSPSTLLKSKIFSLRFINFQMISVDTLLIRPLYSIRISNFDQIEINHLSFQFTQSSAFIIQNNNTRVDLNLIDFAFEYCNFTNMLSQFQNQIFGDIIAKNFSILDSTLINTSIFNLEAFKQNGIITIKTFLIQRCILQDSTIFQFGNDNFNIFISDLIIDQCDFQNSSIFQFYDQLRDLTSLTIYNLKIQNSTFNQSNLIKNANLVQISITNLNLITNHLFSSNLISFNYHLTLQTSYIYQNYFIESQLLKQLQIAYSYKVNVKIDSLTLKENQFKKYGLLFLYSSQLSNVYLDLSFIRLEENSKQSTIDDQNALFIIQCYQLNIQDAAILNVNDMTILKIYESFQIVIENVVYQNSKQAFKVPLSPDCQGQMKWKNQLIGIIGFFSIRIRNVSVTKQFNIDFSIIDISSSRGYSEVLLGIISIEKLRFKENVQISNYQYNLMSLLTIHAENELTIVLNNISFIENIVHTQVNSNSQQAASLMFITSLASTLAIKNTNSVSNAFTNSTNTFINIICNKLTITNFTTTNSNVLTQEQWSQYYDIQLEEKLNQENMNNLIIQILNIQNIGGACSITSSEFFCFDCSFTNILAQKSSVFLINTINKGHIVLDQLKVISVEHKIQFITNSSGCISINSQNSLLNLEITNAIFSNVLNRMASSIFTVIPSQIQNKISFYNSQVLNCFSLINQVFYLQFSPQNIINNFIILQNLTIIQTEDKWKQYFSNIYQISDTEMIEIAGQSNAVIYIENAQIFIKEISISGIYLSTLMKFNNVNQFVLLNFELQDIQLFYPCNVIVIDQNVDIKMIISFQQVQMRRIRLFNTNQSLQQSQFHHYQIKNCKLFQELSDRSPTSIDIQSIYNTLFKLSQKSLSIIQIASIFFDNQIIFNNIKLQDNECSFCTEGLIYFEIEDIKYLKISSISCISNSILSYGCLVFYQKNQINFNAKIMNSIFYGNRGSIGVGITTYNQSLIIESCKILRNIASSYGGGVYLVVNNNSVIFNQSIIINNQAQDGGGIYFNGEYNLDHTNFINTQLLDNNAQVFANNLIESPTHLALIINQKELRSINLESNGSSNQLLIIDPYLIIEQEKSYYTKYLMLPNGQEIKNYEIVLPKNSNPLQYIYEIVLTFKNSRNELLFNLINSTCSLNSFIQYKNGSIQEIRQIASIDYNSKRNYFDLGLISVVFDPYDQNNKYLQIEATCKMAQSNKTLNYSMNIKSFKCQLGEFYTQQGCQKCIASQGFYSVTYDAIKCSIFDKSKFQEITQNKMNLLQGFWRPDYLSDYTSYCFKNKDFCIGGWSYGNNLCQIGHIGALCEECDIQNILGGGKYFKNQHNLECQICQEQANNIASFIFTLIWAICSIMLTLKSIEKSNLMFSQLKSTERFNKILFKLNQDHQSILIKMLLNYLWIFSLIFTFNLQFSISLFFIDSASNTSYFMANNLDCYLANIQNIDLIYSKIFTMLIFIFMQFLFVIAGFMIYQNLINQKYNSSIISNTLLSLYIFNYAGLIKMLCSIISNRSVSNVNYIQGDVSLLYGNQTHLAWMFYFVIPILILFGCLAPFSLFMIMYSKRKYLDQIKLRRHLCYLFNEYNDSSYFWEQIKLVQKFIMILISTYFETEISMKASVFGISLLCYQLLTVKQKPYLTSRLNNLDLQTGQICSLSIFLATINYISEQNNNGVVSIILQTVILFLCVKLCHPFIWSIAQINYKKNKVPLMILLSILFQKLQFKRCLDFLSDCITKEKDREQRIKANYLKLKTHLFQTSKAVLTNRKNLLTQANTSSINYCKKFRISENFATNQFFTLETN